MKNIKKQGIDYGEMLDGMLYVYKSMDVFEDGTCIGNIYQTVKDGTWRGSKSLNQIIDGLPNDTTLKGMQNAIEVWHDIKHLPEIKVILRSQMGGYVVQNEGTFLGELWLTRDMEMKPNDQLRIIFTLWPEFKKAVDAKVAELRKDYDNQ